MKKSFKIILLLVFITLFSSTLLAQDDNPYADMETSRTEDGGFVLGNPDAPVKLIEFADFLCPHCQDYKSTVDSFIEQYVATGQAKFEYRMVPIVDSTLSPYAASLVECANIAEGGLFWYAHDVMFELTSTATLSADSVTEFADTLGLDEDELTNCALTANQYETDVELALSLGVGGTPTVAMQYGDSAPILFELPNENSFELLVNANRPATSDEPVVIEAGRYKDIQTYRTDDGGFVLGDPDAPLTVVAFEDFMCPHCQDYQTTVHTFVEDYVSTGQAKFEYRFFPVVNPEFSMLTANVAECVALQDLSKFWDAHDLLFEFASTGEIDSEVASVIAMLVGVDADEVNECLDISLQPTIDLLLGRQLEVTGTPGIRARGEDGQIDTIYAGQQPLSGGGLPTEALVALVEGSDELTIGQPELTVINNNHLTDDSLITSEPCSAPCWQGITPSETTLEEAQTIIEQLANSDIQEDVDSFIFSLDSSVVCCQITAQGSTNVETILLQLAPTNTLGAVIENLGEPTFVSGEPFTEKEYIIRLFYSDINTLLFAVVDGPDGQLSEESPIFTVIYVTDDLMERLETTTPLDDWKGYLTYNEYMDGEFDHNN